LIRRASIEKITSIDVAPSMPTRARALVTGRVTRRPDGRLYVAFRLWDVFDGTQLTGQQYFSTPENLRRIANIISDAIYERVTGEREISKQALHPDESGWLLYPHLAQGSRPAPSAFTVSLGG
jgi:TolB protein